MSIKKCCSEWVEYQIVKESKIFVANYFIKIGVAILSKKTNSDWFFNFKTIPVACDLKYMIAANLVKIDSVVGRGGGRKTTNIDSLWFRRCEDKVEMLT